MMPPYITLSDKRYLVTKTKKKNEQKKGSQDTLKMTYKIKQSRLDLN